jgi:hypothetical protein
MIEKKEAEIGACCLIWKIIVVSFPTLIREILSMPSDALCQAV